MDKLSEKIIAEVEKLAQPLLESEGITLIDVEYRREPRGLTLRLIVDKEGGINLQDCSEISSQFGDLLDAKIDVHGPYNMEVSSPGLDRALTKPRHFAHFTGRQVVLRTREPIDGKKNLKGTLSRFSDGIITLDAEGKSVEVPYESILKARLDF